MAYEALYRRYRPSTFEDAFFGQDHVKAALRNAVEGDRVGHAYLFSGPRGTGKTTSARILAKALNCTNLHGGEPCNECDSCEAFNSGSSYDLHELDAASNNGVDAMRDLIGKVALGSPGRTKVYILDEVHMLSSGAENALLKTLEEPPPHVVFVLATTEPNKVVPTIRSRTQHLRFSLLNQSEVAALVDHVVADAELTLTEQDRAYVIRSGGGSARDTLSALDQVVAAGGAPSGGEHLDQLFGSLVDRDGAAALNAIDRALQVGRDPAGIGATLLAELRLVFLATMRADLGHLRDTERERAEQYAASMPPARVTRAIEVLGSALIEMRQAPDPRVDLEVAIMRLTRTDLATDPAALLQRIEALEAGAVAPSPTGGPGQGGDASAPETLAGEHATPTSEAVGPASDEQVPRDTQNLSNGPGTGAAPASVDQVPTAPDATPEGEPGQAGSSAPSLQAGRAPSAGKRGADMARAILAQQGAARSTESAATQPDQQQSTSAESEPSNVTGAPHYEPAPTSAEHDPPKTLADRRRLRQAAATEEARNQPAQAPSQTAQAPSQPAQAPGQPGQSGQAPGQPGQPAQARSQPAQAPSQTAQAPGQTDEPQGGAQSPSQPGQGPGQPGQSGQPPGQAGQAPGQTDETQGGAGVAERDTESTQPGATQPPSPSAQAELTDRGEASAGASTAAGSGPSLAQLEAAWNGGILESMSGRVRSRFTAGRFLEGPDGVPTFGLPNPVHRDRCAEVRGEFDAALEAHFATPVPIELVVDTAEVEPDIFDTPSVSESASDAPPEIDHEDEAVDVNALTDADDAVPMTNVEMVMATFEGSTLLEDPSSDEPDGR